jgi:hypothetical protein
VIAVKRKNHDLWTLETFLKPGNETSGVVKTTLSTAPNSLVDRGNLRLTQDFELRVQQVRS